ncbi:MAG: hypothetical protein DDT33_01573 [Firmicutes bacterium]|nr:hypothetical protein [Bacillota bacterium]
MNEFRTNPRRVLVIGNAINSDLINLNDFTRFIRVRAALHSDPARVVGGVSFAVMRMVHAP